MKKKIAVIAIMTAIAFAAAIGVGALVSYMLAPPLKRLERAIDKSYKAIVELSPAAKTLDKVFNGGSIEIKGNLRPIVENMTGFGIDVDGTAKMYFGADDEFALKASIGKSGIYALDALLYADDKKLQFSSDTLTGGETYGLRFDDVSEKWDSSIFGKNGRFSLGADSKTVSEALRLPERRKELEKKTNEALSELERTISDILAEYSRIDTLSSAVVLNGTEIGTFDIIFTFEGRAIVDAFDDLFYRLKQIDSIESLLTANEDKITSILEKLEIPTDIYSLDGFSDILDNAIAVFEAVEDTYESALFTTKVHISKTSAQIIGIEFGFENLETEMELDFLCAPSWDNIDVMSLSYSDSNGDTVSVSYTVEEDTDTFYKATLTFEAYGEPLGMSGKVLWNKQSGALGINFTSDEHEIIFDGGYISGNRNKTITVDNLVIDGEESPIGGLEMTFSIAAKMPEAKKYHNLLDMNNEEADTLAGKISTSIGKIFATLAPQA